MFSAVCADSGDRGHGFRRSAQNYKLLIQHQFRELAGPTDAPQGALRSYCDKHPLATYWEVTSAVFSSFPLKETGE
jgi:hypothetical protein